MNLNFTVINVFVTRVCLKKIFLSVYAITWTQTGRFVTISLY